MEVLKYLCRLRGDEPAEKQQVEHVGVTVMKPDRIRKPADAGKAAGQPADTGKTAAGTAMKNGRAGTRHTPASRGRAARRKGEGTHG